MISVSFELATILVNLDDKSFWQEVVSITFPPDVGSRVLRVELHVPASLKLVMIGVPSSA